MWDSLLHELEEIQHRLAENELFFYLAAVPLLGVFAQWLAWRLRLPSILLLLGFGVTLGIWCNPDEILSRTADVGPLVGPKVLSPLVALSVAVILFEGGLTLRLKDLTVSGPVVFRLVTIGALTTGAVTALAAWWLFGLEPRMAALLGAILTVTGPTVVAPMLRQIRPSRRVGSAIKWEGIVIDPVGAILAVLVFEEAFVGDGQLTWAGTVAPLLKTGLIGVVGGLGTSLLLVQLTKRYWIPDYLHGVVFLSAAMAAFAVSNLLQAESGLLTVTVLGIALANQKQVSIAHVTEFKEHLGVFLISALFIVLGSRLDLRELWNLGWPALAFVVFLILVVRPLSVFLSTWGSRLNWRERTFMAFLAPRGIVAAAVSSVFALEIRATEYPADQPLPLVPITFLVIVGTVAVYGLIAAPLAKKLGLAESRAQGILFAGAEPWIRELAALLHKAGHTVVLVDTNYAHVAAARMEGLRAECTSVLSEFVREEMDLGGIGRLMALTGNDGVNALAVREFVHIFGRRNAYQLPAVDAKAGARQTVAHHLNGRILFHEDLNHDEIAARVFAGWTFKRTQLTSAFGYDDFRDQNGEQAIVTLLEDSTGILTIAATDAPLVPESGHIVYALVPPRSAINGSA